MRSASLATRSATRERCGQCEPPFGSASGPDRRRGRALARRNLALYLAYAGKVRSSLREIEAAHAGLRGIERARTEVFRIPIYEMAGRGNEAVAGSSSSLRILHKHGDLVWEARLLYNRAAALTTLGQHGRARTDLERARDLYDESGLAAAASDARIELARARFREGDYLACLDDLDQIDVSALSDWAGLSALPLARGSPRRTQASAGSTRRSRPVRGARPHAPPRRSTPSTRSASMRPGSHSRPATRRPPRPWRRRARRAFAARGQPTFSAEATLVAVAVAARQGSVTRSMLRAGSQATQKLTDDGRVLDALRGHLTVARAAAVSNLDRIAEHELAAARPLERRGTVVDRIELRYVDASRTAWTATRGGPSARSGTASTFSKRFGRRSARPSCEPRPRRSVSTCRGSD